MEFLTLKMGKGSEYRQALGNRMSQRKGIHRIGGGNLSKYLFVTYVLSGE